jgi:hypothetical protein
MIELIYFCEMKEKKTSGHSQLISKSIFTNVLNTLTIIIAYNSQISNADQIP